MAGKAEVAANEATGEAADQIDAFFAHLADTSDLRATASLAQIPVATVRKWRREDAAFSRRFDQAVADAVDDLRLKALAQGRFGRSVSETTSTGKKAAGTVRGRSVLRDHAVETLAALERLYAGRLPETAPGQGDGGAGVQPRQPVVRDALVAEALAIGLAELVRRRMTGEAGKKSGAGTRSGTARPVRAPHGR